MPRRKAPGEDLGRYAKVYRRIWSDGKFRSLGDDGKLLFLRLLTGPEASIVPGVVMAWDAGLARSLKWLPERFRTAWDELSRTGIAFGDWDAGMVFLPNAVEYNEPANPNVVIGWSRAWAEVPEGPLKVTAYRALEAYFETRRKGFLEGFRKAFANDSGNGFPNRIGNQDQDQEQDQEQKKGDARVWARAPAGAHAYQNSGQNPPAESSAPPLLEPTDPEPERPVSWGPYEAMALMKATAEQKRPTHGFWQPGRFAFKDLQQIFDGAPADPEGRARFEQVFRFRVAAYFELEDEILARDGWPVRRFVDRFNGLGGTDTPAPTEISQQGANGAPRRRPPRPDRPYYDPNEVIPR